MKTRYDHLNRAGLIGMCTAMEEYLRAYSIWPLFEKALEDELQRREAEEAGLLAEEGEHDEPAV